MLSEHEPLQADHEQSGFSVNSFQGNVLTLSICLSFFPSGIGGESECHHKALTSLVDFQTQSLD